MSASLGATLSIFHAESQLREQAGPRAGQVLASSHL
jgi:hypothetical protein